MHINVKVELCDLHVMYAISISCHVDDYVLGADTGVVRRSIAGIKRDLRSDPGILAHDVVSSSRPSAHAQAKSHGVEPELVFVVQRRY